MWELVGGGAWLASGTILRGYVPEVRGGEVGWIGIKMCGLGYGSNTFVEADSHCDCPADWCLGAGLQDNSMGLILVARGSHFFSWACRAFHWDASFVRSNGPGFYMSSYDDTSNNRVKH